MQESTKSNTFATGLVMFSMFFGAGNVVFPLALGQYAQDKTIFAILGLLITAVGVPFLGLVAMTLFHGNYKEFFNRMGRIPGFLVALAIMGLIGPFGAIPRCITLTFSTIKMYMPGVSLPMFSVIACALIVLLTIRKNNLLDVLGYYLTPILLGSLAIIVVKGVFFSPELAASGHEPIPIFLKGLFDGYQTMDLLGAFFFSSIVISCLTRQQTNPVQSSNPHRLMKLVLKSSVIGASLLALAYVGFSFTAAFHSESLATVVKHDELPGKIATLILGQYAGVVACVAVALACLTTAIALAAVFAEYVQKEVSSEKISYEAALIGTAVISCCVSTLDFTAIASFLAPILQICYPALIVLCITNILYKLFGFKYVKLPVFITFTISLLAYILS